jgi:dihydrofolate synthase/folylpolyglutamate synthase
VLAEAMADFEDASPRPLAMICGTLTTKDTAGFLTHFEGLAREVVAVPILGEHAARSADEVAIIARSVGLNATAAENVGAALDLLAQRDWSKAPRVLIAGSLYLAGAVLQENGNLPK